MKKLVTYSWCLVVFFAIASCGGEKQQENTVQSDQVEQIPESAQLDSLNAWIQKDPGNAELYFKRGEYYFKNGSFNSAIQDFEEAIKLNSKDARFYISLSEAYFNKEDITRAQTAIEEGLKVLPKDVNLLLLMARYQLYLKEFPMSIQNADKALQQDVFNPDAYFIKGMVLKEVGDTAKAISNFITATEQNPEMYDAWMQIGLLYNQRQDSAAIVYFKNALRVQPESKEAKYGIAMSYQLRGDNEKAKAAYRDMIAAQPNNERAIYNIGYIYFQEDSLEKAERNFDMAIQVASQFANAYYMKGLCAEIKGDPKQAESLYLQTLKLDANHNLALAGMGRLKKIRQ